jgi:hypothetical protein
MTKINKSTSRLKSQNKSYIFYIFKKFKSFKDFLEIFKFPKSNQMIDFFLL